MKAPATSLHDGGNVSLFLPGNQSGPYTQKPNGSNGSSSQKVDTAVTRSD